MIFRKRDVSVDNCVGSTNEIKIPVNNKTDSSVFNFLQQYDYDNNTVGKSSTQQKCLKNFINDNSENDREVEVWNVFFYFFCYSKI